MAFFNPAYAFLVPFLFVATVPLAVFAGITSTLAFGVLIFRVFIVYVDLVLSLLPKSPFSFGTIPRHTPQVRYRPGIALGGTPGPGPFNFSHPASRDPSPTLVSLRRRRRRPSSTASVASAGSATTIGETAGSNAIKLGVTPSIGLDRDYEGVGGWRDDGGADDDDTWSTINSRMEMPNNERRHGRSTSGATTPGEGYLMMKVRTRSPEAKVTKLSTSPNSSRTRTPSGSRPLSSGRNHDGYFPAMMSPKATKKVAS